MRRFWVGEENIFSTTSGTFFKIEGQLFHHVCEVCRYKKGDQVEFLTKNSGRYVVEIVERKTKVALARMLKKKSSPSLSSSSYPSFHLALSLARLSTMDAVIEKASELGVESFQPFISDFSFLKKKESLSEARKKRWSRIAESACQQSNRTQPMKIHSPLFLEELWLKWESLKNKGGVGGVLAYEGECQRELGEILVSPELAGSFSLPSSSSSLNSWTDFCDIWLFVGSEGGFSPLEVEGFSKRGLFPVSMGSLVLKVETACVALVSVMKHGSQAFPQNTKWKSRLST